MHRRTYLASITGSGISGLTGCISSISSSESTLDPITGTWPTYRATTRRTGTSGSTTLLDTDPSIAWEHSTEGVVYEPIVTREQVLAGTSAGKVIAVTAQTGERNWTWTAGAAVNTPPTVAGEQVFIRSRAGVHSVDLNTGDVQWTHSFDTKSDAPPAVLGPAPAYRDSVLYIVTPAGELRAYAAADGDGQWTVSLPEAIRTTPAVGTGQIFVTTEAGALSS